MDHSQCSITFLDHHHLGLETSLNEAQMRAIIMFAQKEMDGASLSNVPQHAIVPAAETAKAPANQALLRLYDYLHMLSLHLQIELIYIQVHHVMFRDFLQMVSSISAAQQTDMSSSSSHIGISSTSVRMDRQSAKSGREPE
jgi:hypothetical protein